MDFRGNGLGDQVLAEPIVRFANKIYQGRVAVLTDFPEIFTHVLPSASINPSSLAPDDVYLAANPYYWEQKEQGWKCHPLAEYIIPGRIHAIDFMSLFLLRQMLPDKDKRIRLAVRDEVKQKILNSYPNVKDSWLIHPSYGSPAKSFGKEWWEQIGERLKAKGLETILIGKNYKYTTIDYGVYAIPCTYDTVDSLNLEELFGIISLAKGILTTDSAPFHIAGAFNARIVLIASIKHPDFIKPLDRPPSLLKVPLPECLYADEYPLAPHLKKHTFAGEMITPLQPNRHFPTVDNVVDAVISWR